MAVVYEKLVSSAESTIVSSFVCSLVEGRVHVVVNHGNSLSVREVRKNHVELITVAATGPIVYMRVIRRGTRGVIFLLLEHGVMKMMGLSKGGGGEAWELFTNWSKTLSDMAGRSGALCEYDEHRCAIAVFVPVEPIKHSEVFNSKKRSVVIAESPALVYLLRFSFDKFPKIITRVDSIKWRMEWTPLAVSFINSETAPWSFGCYHPSVGIKTFAVKVEECEFRELKLVVDTAIVSSKQVCGIHFIEGTSLLVAYASELGLFAGAKFICSLRFPPPCSFVRLFPLGPKQFIASLSDGSLHLISVAELSMSALPLGVAGCGVASAVSLLSTVSFKQGACHVLFVASSNGDTSLYFMVPSNPKARRLQTLTTNLSLAPVSQIVSVPQQRRVYLSFGLNQNSGVASMERLLRYRGMIRFPQEQIRDALPLDDTRCALSLGDGSTRVMQLVATAPLVDDDEYKLVELQVPSFPSPTIAFWSLKQEGEARYLRCSSQTIELLSTGFGVLNQAALPFSAVSAFPSGGFAVVLGNDGQILRFNLVKDLTIAGKSALPSSSDSKLHQLIGVEGILMCIHNGVLHSDQGKFGNKWEPFPMRGLTNKTVVAIATSPLKEGNPFVYIGAVCFSRPSPNVRHWFVVIFAYWLHSPSTSTAADSLVFLFAENCGVDALSVNAIRFSSDTRFKQIVSINVSGNVYCVTQSHQDAWVGHRMVDDFFSLATLSSGPSKKVSILSSSSYGAALAWNGEVSHVPNLVYRHTSTISFLAAFPEISLMIGVDFAGSVFGLSTNQIHDSTKQFVCHANLFQVPERSIVSDVQRITVADGSYVLAIAMVDLDVNLAKTESRLIYCNRRIVFFSVSMQNGACVLRPTLSEIPWPGIGSCLLKIRSVPQFDQLVAVCDSQFKVFSLADASKPSLSMDLRSGNDIISNLSVQNSFVSLSHLFGAVVVMKYLGGTFELLCKKSSSSSSDGAGGTLMLSETFAVTCSSKNPGFSIATLGGNKLVPSLLVPTQGLVSVCSGSSDMVFVGTTKGEVVAMRLISDELVTKMAIGVPAIEAKVVRSTMEQNGQALPKFLEDGLSWV